MALISDLLGLGRKSPSRTIADVEEALARLSTERATAQRAIADALHERDALLLIDDSDKAIAKLDVETDRHRLTVERCDKAEPLLLDELQQLRSEAKQVKWRELRARYDKAALAYAQALRVTLEKMSAMTDVHNEARAAGFEHETQATFVAPARPLTIESLNVFEAAIERSREMARPAPAPAPTPTPVKAKPAIAPSKPVKPTKATRERVVEPAGPGQVQARVQRSGYEANGRQYAEGDIVALSAERARVAIANGALDGAVGAASFS